MPEIFEKLGLDGKLIIAQIVNFILLLIILQKLAYRPVLKMLEERSKKIEKSLKQAEKIEKELKNTEEIKLAEIKKAKEESQKIINEAIKSSEKKSQEALEKIKIKTQEVVERAKREIRLEKENSIKEAKKEISDIALRIATKIMGNNIDDSRQKKLVDEALSRIK